MKKKNKLPERPSYALGHTKLEPRRLLNADFNLMGGALTLDGFVDAGGPIDSVTISQSGTDYTFVLSDGVWSGDDSDPGVTLLAGDTTLEIDSSMVSLTSILMDSNLTDGFDIDFGDFSFSGDFDITSTGTSFNDVTQIGSTSITHIGTFDIDGATNITLGEIGNDFDVVNIENATAVTLNDSNDIQFTSLDSTANSTVTAGGNVDLTSVLVVGDLDVSTTVGNIIDSGVVDVNGNAQFAATAGSISLDLLDVSGSIGLDSLTTSTIVNTTGVDLSASTIGTDLDVTATTGDITDSGVVDVNGTAQLSAAAGAIDLGDLDVSGSIGLTSLTTASIVNTMGVDLSTSMIGTDLDVAATTGDITDSGVVTVGGMAQFDAAAGLIDLGDLDVTGSIGLTSLTSATIVNTTAVDLATSTVGTDLDATATTGDVTDSGTLTVGGDACFTATVGAIDLDQLAVTGSIGLTSGTTATVVTTAVDLKTSTVGTDLDVTATTGDITDSGVVTVGGTAQFDAAAGLIDLGDLDVTGSIGLTSLTSATIVNTTAVDLATSTVGTDLDATATTGDVTDSGTLTVGGDACFTATVGAIDLDQLAVTGSIGLVSGTTATVVTTTVDLKTSTVGTDLDVTATTGDITDSGVVTVGGTAQFDAAAGLIDLGDMDVSGSIGLTSLTTASIVNTMGVDLSTSMIGTDLDVTATTGDITDSGVVTVGGMAQFDAAAGLIDLGDLDVTGSIGLTSLTSATIVNTTAVDLATSTVGTDLDATATTGDVTDSGTLTVGGDACFTATVGAIDLDQLAVTGSIGLTSGTTATVVTTAVDLKTSTVGTDLDVTATTGDITDSGVVTVGGMAQFDAAAGLIDLSDLDVTGSIGLTSLTSATIVNTTAVDLATSTVGTDLDATATTGDVTDSGTLTVGGDACFTATVGAIDLDQLAVTGSIGLVSGTTATVVTTAVDLKTSTVGTDLDVTATTGDITDSGVVTVGGTAQFDAAAGLIDLGDLDVTGSIGLTSLTTASIVNTMGVDLSTSMIGTDLDVTATTGDITDSGVVTVGGMAQFDAAAGLIDLGDLDVTGSIGLTSLTSATIVNTTAVDLATSTVGTDLDATATTGDVTDSGTLTVGGDACFTATVGAIDLDQLAVTGSIGLTSGTTATVVTTAVDLKTSTVGTDLDVTATTGDITDSGVVTVGGTAQFDAAAGLIDLGDLDVTGSIGLTSLTSATIVNTTAVDLATSTVGTDLDATATTGDVTDSGTLTVGGDACFTATVGAIDLDQLAVTGSIGLTSGTTATVVTTTVDLKTSTVGTDLDVTATTGDITDSGVVTVGGTAQFDAAAGLIDLGDLDVTGSIGLTSLTTASIVNTMGVDLSTSMIGTDLDVTATSGGISQSGSIVVGGTSAFSAMGTICLNDPTNDFMGEVTATGMTVELVDRNSLTTGLIDAVDDIFLRSGATESGSLVLNGNVVTSAGDGQVLLQSDTGVTQLAGTFISTNELLLGGDAADEGSGDFVLDGANVVDQIAADLEADLEFNNTTSLLTISNLTYDSACGTTETICGLNIGGDLDLTTNNGDLFQAPDPALPTVDSAAVIVAGNTVIDTGTGDVCLTGGDCDGNGINENIFVGMLSIVSSGDVVIAENDVVSIDSIGGGGSYRFIGTNIQINTAITGDQLLLEASDGVSYNGNVIDVTDLMLSGMGAFDFGTSGGTANSIDNLAVDIDGSLTLVNSTNLDIGDLLFTSGCGDVAICGVNIDVGAGEPGSFDLFLENANLTQSAAITVEGDTLLDVGTGVICLTGGDCDGDTFNDNDFVGEVTASGTTVEIVDSNDLLVGTITATDDIFLRSGDSGVPGTLNEGTLTLTGTLVTGVMGDSGQILLQSDDGVMQTSGMIQTSELLLGGDIADEGTGDFILTSATNAVSLLAADLEDSLEFTDSISLEIADLTYSSVCPTTEAICGLNIGGDLVLDITGSLSQTAAVIVQGTSSLTATETICLTGGDCDGDTFNDNDFVGEVTASGTTVEIVDSNDLVVGTITATDDIFLRSGDSGVPGTLNEGMLTLTGTLVTGVMGDSGQILLQSDDGVMQTSGMIQTSELLLGGDIADEGTGDFILTSATNAVSLLAADLEDSLEFTDSISLEIADLMYSSVCPTTEAICGLNIGGDLVLDITGSLSQTAAVIVQGTSSLTATETICLTGGDCDGDTFNDNDFVGEVTASGTTVEIVDSNDLLVGTITATDDIFLRSGDSGVPGTLNEGMLTLTGTLVTGVMGDSGQILLQSDDGVMQTSGMIQTSELLLGGDIADESTGDFILTSATNAVSLLAADLEDSLEFTDSISLEIADLMYSSVCPTTEAICGLNIGGDLVLDITGSLSQTAAVIVQGTSSLTATEMICLTGGDCDGDTFNDNDFVGEVTASGTTVEIVDSNDLLVGTITATDDIFLRSGDSGVPGTLNEGMLTLTGTLVTGVMGDSGQILLQSDDGVMQTSGMIQTSELLLGGDIADEGTGDFILTSATNAVSLLAADLEDSLEFTDSISLEIADLTYSSVCPTTEAICGLNIGGDLVLDITGSLSQTAAVIVQGTSSLTATETICLTGGDCDGDTFNDNDFVGEVTASGTTVEIVDSNDLLVGTITATDDIFLRSGDSGVPGTLNEGTLTLTGTLVTGVMGDSGQILLQSDDGVMQTSGMIQTSELLLGGDIADEGTGDFILTSATNAVSLLAADLEDSLEFTDSISLEIADLTYSSVCPTTEAICGLNIGGDLVLDITGSLSQTAAVIVQGTSSLTATETICLTGGDCDGDTFNDNDFVGEVTASGTTVEIVDSNDLLVGTITATDDIFLRSGDSGVPGTLNEGTLTLTGTLVTGVMGDSGQILLQSDDGVMQTSGMIQTSELLLGGDIADEGTGDFILTSATNAVSLLAADLEDSLEFTDSISLEIADLTYSSVCPTTEAICGLNIGGDLVLDITGSLSQTAAVIVQGTSSLTATETICLTGGDCDGDTFNDNDFVGEVTASGTTVEIVDSNDLLVGTITATDDIFLRSGDSGVPGTLNEGTLTLTGTLVTGVMGDSGQILLQSDDGVMQTSGMIQTSELLLGGDIADESTGDFILTSATNAVSLLAADLEDSLEFTDSISLEIADLTYSSVCPTTEAICGLNIGGDLVLDITGSLSQTAAVIVQGTSSLTATETICLTGGDCDGDTFNDNDFVGEVTASGTTVEIVDSNDLVVGDVNAVDDIFLRSGDNGSGALLLNGDLTTSAINGQVLLQSDSGVSQTSATSVITTSELMVGGDDVDEATGDFNLVGQNVVENLAGNLFDGALQFVNNQNLLVRALAYSSDCGTAETLLELRTEGSDSLASEIVVESQLDDTIQADGRYNEDFTSFLTVSDIGIAIENEGSFENVVEISTSTGDILIQTKVADIVTADDITINSTITVDDNANRILIVAGGDLDLNASLVRGSAGIVLSESNINPGTISGLFSKGYIAENPGPVSESNAQVDTTNLNQDLQYIFGRLTELIYTTDVFWGIDLGDYPGGFLVPDFTILDSLSVDQLQQFNGLLFGAGFESQSFYDNPFMGGISDTVTSLPINSMVSPASFTLEFLRNNPEFRSILFVYNDAQINIFEGASDNNGNGMEDDLVDLNVAVEDFLGLARVGIPPVVEVERTEFQLPQRVEITVEAEAEFFETIVVDEDPLFVQTVREKFFVVVYFESQFDADQFEAAFEDLDEDESGEKTFDNLKKQILDKTQLEYLQWESGDETKPVDANQIREILERAMLDLENDDDGNWLDEYKDWLQEQSKDRTDLPEVPRGVYKIIEVDNGKATIQGDDVDRRFVPEPDDDKGLKEYQFPDNSDADSGANDDGGTSLYVPDGQDRSTRLARWSAMLSGESNGLSNGSIAESVEFSVTAEQESVVADSRYLAAGSTGLGLLAMLCRHQSKNNKTVDDEIESLGELKSENPTRNIFSRAARFKRRNEFVIQKNEE